MKIKQLSIEGFKTFKTKQVIDFSKIAYGLNFITGYNEVEPRLGANSAGKSSLVSAITTCFFGKTAENLKASDIINWQSKTCIISIIIDKDNIDYEIKRAWSPNKLTLTNLLTNHVETLAQQELENFLGYNFESFLYSIHLAQFTTKFIDLLPSEKLNVFTQILSSTLCKWDTYSEKCKAKLILLEKDVENIRLSIQFKNGNLSALLNTDYDKKSENWEMLQKQHLVDVEAKLKQLETTKTDYINKLLHLDKDKDIIDIGKYDDQIKECAVELNNITQKLTVIVNNINEFQEKQHKLDLLIAKKVSIISVYQKDIQKFIAFPDGAKCFNCGQIITKEHVNNEIGILENKIQDIQTEILPLISQKDNAGIEINKFVDQRNALNREYENINKLLNEIKEDKTNASIKRNKIESEITILKCNIKQALESITELCNKKQTIMDTSNPYKDENIKNKVAIEKQKEEIFQLNTTLKAVSETYEYAKYWQGAFKEIKLRIIDERLKELEIFTNNILADFGMNNWKIIYKICDETKSGTVKIGFITLIKSTDNDSVVPFACWGGGVGQRIRIAGMLGLISFIKSCNPIGFDEVFFDEPTQFLSNEGIEDFVDILDRYVNENHLKGFLIDHRNLQNCGKFNNIINVIRKGCGSVVELK